MDGTGTRRCALPGCEIEVSDIPGRPPRRYCSPAHRGAARQARRRAMRPDQQQRLVATLPWMDQDEPSGDPATSAEPMDDLARAERDRPAADVPGHVVVAEASPPSGVGEPGPVTDADGGNPPEPSCPPGDEPGSSTPSGDRPRSGRAPDAVPGEVPRSGRASRDGPDEPRSGRPSGDAPDPASGEAAARGITPTTRRRWSRRARRQRAVAALGVVGVLVGGSVVAPAQPAPAPALSRTLPSEQYYWAARAQVALASLDEQLDMVARAEDAWNRLPRGDRVALPPVVASLLDRKALLQARRAALSSQLDLYRSLGALRADLATSQQNLDAVQLVLDRTRRAGAAAGADATVLAALAQQRDLRRRQLDAKRAELGAVEADVVAAAHTTPPDDAARTAVIAREVLSAVDDRGPGRGPLPARPAAVAGRRHSGQERKDTPTSGPPDPPDQPGAVGDEPHGARARNQVPRARCATPPRLRCRAAAAPWLGCCDDRMPRSSGQFCRDRRFGAPHAPAGHVPAPEHRS